jgi:hypothetical protein
MGKNRKDAVYGTIGKRESLFVVRGKILHSSIVFESFAPFPGYYSQLENDVKPVYLYLVLNNGYSVFDIERAKLAVKRTLNWRFEAAKAEIDLFDKHFDVVRLRHLDSFDQLLTIQNEFIKANIELKISTLSRVNNDDGFIRLTKIFYIRKLSKGIYLDTSEDYHAYLVLPFKLSQHEFEETTLKVKYNWESMLFDAAMGSFLIKGKLKEMVRIYSKNLTPQYLEDLRKLYLSKMKR